MKKLVIGLCTVSTRKIPYLTTTLRSLLKNISAKNRLDILIRIYNCDPRGTKINPAEGFEREIERGLVEIVRVDNHPEFINLPNNYGDSPERVTWRTKQCYDFSEAFRLSYNLGEYYMHVEDDIIACRDFDSYVFREIKNHENWCSIHLAQGGFIGWVFHNNELPRLSALFREFRDEMPPDWLIAFFVYLKRSTGKQHIKTHYSIFQHIGIERSLQNSTQQVIFDNYIGGHQDLDLLAYQYYQAGDLQQAKDTCMKILKEQPDIEAMVYLLGVVYAQLEEYDLAIKHLKKSIQLNTNNADAYLALGAIFQKKGLPDEAITSYQKAVEIDPDFAEAYENLGDIFRDKRQFDKAITYYKKAIQYVPDSAEIHCVLGNIFREKGQFDLATYYYQKALKLNPNYAEAYVNLGTAFHGKGHFDEAIYYLQQALKINSSNAGAYLYLGDALYKKGRAAEASVAYQNAIELDRDNPMAHFSLAFCLFKLGDLNRGWKEYQWHWKTRDGVALAKHFSQPLWTGFDISGRTVLLHDVPKPLSGFGDTIQFIRYAPLVAQRSAKVIFETHKELVALLKNVAGIHRIIAFGEEPPAFDVHCFLMDLPFVFDISIDTIPSRIPYIPVDPMLSQVWAEKIGLTKDKLKVGLVWAAGGVERSCDLKTFSSLAGSNNIMFYSLQKGPAASEAKNPPNGMRLIDLTEEIHDFMDTAALIENLDLVISVDTAVAHLTGALGKPVWTLLPFVSPWRWMLDRKDSPWYPTMKLFRQPSSGDWESVMAKVASEIAALRSQ